MPPPDSVPESDALLARVLVEQGLVRSEHVEECLRVLSAMAASGNAAARPRLGQILVERGYLTPAQWAKTVRLGVAPAPAVPTSKQQPQGMEHGRQIDKYVLSKKLGAGGMGEVWKAWDTKLDRWVALKFMKGNDPEEIARFRREAQTAARLTHPNIAAVYEAQDDFIAMQFVEGQDLTSFPRDDRRALVEIVRQAALAVHFAHERGVIHRDLKPANLMVESASESGSLPAKAPTKRRETRTVGVKLKAVYVMDFGLARSMTADSRLSASGMIMGTPAYMSPEQARGSRKLGPTTDIHSLGATLYELLSDRPPFAGADRYDLLKKVIEEDPVPVRRLRPSVDRDLETIVMKCLEKDPSRRYGTAQDLSEDLGRWLAGEAILAHPPSTGYRVRKFLLRRKAMVLIGAAGLALAGAVAAVVISGWLREARAVKDREEKLASERAAAAERETAVKELGALWNEVILAKQGFYRASSDPAKVRAKIEESLGKVTAFIADHKDQPQGYYIRARGRLYLDDLQGAEADLRAAIRIEPAFAPGEALLGRVLLERSERLMYGRPGKFQRLRVARQPLLEEARRRLDRGWTQGAERRSIQQWGLSRTAEDHVAEILVRFLVLWQDPAGREEAVRFLMDEYTREPSEEYANCLGWRVADPHERLQWQCRALELMPHYARACMDRGLEKLNSKDVTGARDDFTRAIEINPRLAGAYFDRALAKGGMGELDGAIEDCTRALALDPTLSEAYHNRGLFRLDKGDLPGGIADSDKAIELDPEDEGGYYNRALGRERQGDHDGAIADLTRAVELEPQYTDAYVNRGNARQRKGDLAGALADYETAIRLNPREPEAWHGRGLIRRETGNLDGAISDFTKAIEIDPHHLAARINRGDARYRKDDLEGAIADATQVISIDPRNSKAFHNRGLARGMKGDYDGAIADFRKALEFDPRNVDAAFCLGVGHTQKGDLDAAIEDWTKALEIDPRYLRAWANRALVRLRKGDADGSVADFTRAIELDPGNYGCYMDRGSARKAKGDRDGAIADWEKALQLAPADWPTRGKLEAALRELRQGP